MSITKPYTFSAGTKARANEVNANFDTLYSQVNSNISDIAQLNRDIDLLELTKADVNGNSTQRFAVANPVNPTDTVNKQTLTKSLTNVLDFINGLTISKDSGSPNDTILVQPGSCYDNTREVVLELSNITSKKNSGQGASTTYYVHIIGNDIGSSIDILISNSKLSPTLPTGYTKFRNIGSFTTDSSNHISEITNYSNTAVSDTDWNKSLPSTKYTNLSWVAGSTYTAPADGYYVVWGTFAEGGFAIYNTTTHLGNSCFNNSGASNSGSASMPVRKGQKVQTYFRGGTISGFRFVYAEGVQ